jgi:hypothetical protein
MDLELNSDGGSGGPTSVKGIDVVDGSHRIPKRQLVRRRHRLEAPLDDSLEPRFPVIGRCRRSES